MEGSDVLHAIIRFVKDLVLEGLEKRTMLLNTSPALSETKTAEHKQMFDKVVGESKTPTESGSAWQYQRGCEWNYRSGLKFKCEGRSVKLAINRAFRTESNCHPRSKRRRWICTETLSIPSTAINASFPRVSNAIFATGKRL